MLTVAARLVECATCGDYELVDRGDGILQRCPDCAPEIALCPVHGQKVMTRNGELAGKCWGCMKASADGLLWLREHPC